MNENLIQKLSKLVSFPTVSGDHVANTLALDWIDQQLNQHGLATTRLHCDGYPTLIAATHEPKKPRVVLQAHLDVVPGDVTQFEPQVADGKLFGRGVYDMKFAIACYLQFIEEFHGKLDDYDFSIVISTDEELGGKNGVKFVVEQGYLGDVVFLPDGGDNWNVDVGSRGIWHIELEAEGDSAHGSRPWDGDNALLKLLGALNDLNDLFDNTKESDISFAVTSFASGKAHNQIPDYARATCDMRYVSNEAYLQAKHTVEEILLRHKGVGYVTVNQDGLFTVPESNGYLKDYKKLVKKHARQTPQSKVSYGSSDARFYATQGIASIISRPIGGDAHGEDEWIDVESLTIYYKVFKEFMEKRAKR